VRVLIDRHHAGLFHSLQLLGDRLGWDISTPVGLEWWDEGYWDFGRKTWGDDRLARQFLLGAWAALDEELIDFDPEFPDRPIHGVTLDEVRSVGFDAVPYDEMVRRYNPNALKDGYNTLPDGEEIFYISNPALGLWAYTEKFSG